MSETTVDSKVIHNSGHKTVITDVAFDYYGKRFATVSSDAYVKVWNQLANGVDCLCTARWKAHNESINRVIWYDPSFGHIIATCSHDKSVYVWEEITEKIENKNVLKWVKKGSIARSRPVIGIKLSPKCSGLLAVLCDNGIVTIHEADMINLSNSVMRWKMACNAKCTSIDWNTYITPDSTALIAVGCDVANMSENNLLIYRYRDVSNDWSKLENVCVIRDAVKDVCFAPNIGRSFELLAVATIVGVYIIKITNKPKTNQTVLSGTSTQTDNEYCCEIVASLYDHETVVWRLSWNIVGSILASRGDDECVRLWKYDNFQWKCVGALKDYTQQVFASNSTTISSSITSVNTICQL